MDIKRARRDKQREGGIIRIAIGGVLALIFVGILIHVLGIRQHEEPNLLDQRVRKLKSYQDKLNMCNSYEDDKNCRGLKEEIKDYLILFEGITLPESTKKHGNPQSRTLIKKLKNSNCPCLQ